MKKNDLGFLTQQGFTLVELMVVVGIIGLLSAVALPNFKKYQAKSKTSEAKLQLAAAYTAQVSFYTDYDTYASCLATMGYDPSGEAAARYYTVGIATAFQTAAASTAGATGCSSQNQFVATKLSAGVTSVLSATGGAGDASTFSVFAQASLNTSGTDAWYIDHNKRLVNAKTGY